MNESKELKSKKETDISYDDSFYNNILNFREIKADNFEENLNISDIKEENNKNQQNENFKIIKNSKSNSYINKSEENDFSEELDNLNEDEFNQKKLSLCSSQSEEINYNNTNKINSNANEAKFNIKLDIITKKTTKRLTKEELNNIPLPVFSCIYCSNEIIAFNHLLQEIVSNKYLLQTSIYDIKDINKLITCQPIQDKYDKNEKLLNIVIKNTDYIYKNYNYKEINIFFHSKSLTNLCNKKIMNYKKVFIQNRKESMKKKKDFYFKGINKITKNSLNNRCLFNSTNSLINNYNALTRFVEKIPINNNNKKGKVSNTNNSNISINFNSISLYNNDIENCPTKDNNNLLSIVENIENNIESENVFDDKDEIVNIFGFDMERKVNKNSIIWDNKYYDIWNPVISDEEENNNKYNKNNKSIPSSSNIKKNLLNRFKNNNYNSILLNLTCKELNKIKEKNLKLKVNELKSKENKSSTSNNSSNYKINRNISQMRSIGSTNNSSVINFNSEYKIKRHIKIFNHLKNLTKNSQKTIHVNTKLKADKSKKIKNNHSLDINRAIFLKSKNVLKELINNQFKKRQNSFHKSNLFDSNKVEKKFKTIKNNNNNKFSSNSSNFNTINSKSIKSTKNILTNEKYKKKKIKIFFERKGKKKIKKTDSNNKNKQNSKKLNTFNTPNSLLHNKRNQNKSTLDNRTENMTISTSINNSTKVISSKLIFKRNNNNNFRTNFINSQKSFQLKNYKLSYCSFKNNIERTSLERIKNKISEISKLINNNKNYKVYNTINKLKYDKIASKYNLRVDKTRNKLELNNNKITNNKTCISTNIKYCQNTNKKLLFSSSFIVKPKTKVNEKNNIKKI